MTFFNLSTQILLIQSIIFITSFSCIIKIPKAINNFLYLLCSLILVFFTATRTWGGDDFFVYEGYFSGPDAFFIQYGKAYELLTKAFIFLNFEFKDFLFATSIFTASTQLWFINKYSKLPLLSLLWYFSSGYIWINHILIRQSLSISLGLIFIHLIIINKKKLSLVPLLLGVNFHGSAIFYTSLIRFKAFYYFLIILCVSITLYIITLNGGNLVSQNLLQYIYSEDNEGFSKVLILEFLVFLFIIYRNKNKEQQLYTNSFLLLISFTLMAIFIVPPSSRILDLFKILSSIVLINFITNRRIEIKFLLFSLIALISFIRMITFLNTFDGGMWNI